MIINGKNYKLKLKTIFNHILWLVMLFITILKSLKKSNEKIFKEIDAKF